MTRRNFLNSAASGGLAASAASAAGTPKNSIYELRYFHLRNGNQVARTTEFLKHLLPAYERAGAGPLGLFNQFISEQGPFILAVVSYPSFDAIGAVEEKLMHDEELGKAMDQFNSATELSFIRMENSLLRAFDCQPTIAIPKPAEKGTHIFELRTYESPNIKAGHRKVKMFNDGEAAIFRRLGMQPVFFGQTIVGRNLPSLTYMLTFDDMAARDRLFGAFGNDPEWKKMRAEPELADALIVSNISNTLLKPLPFSAIK